MTHVNWADVAAFTGPLIAVIIFCFAAAAGFVRTQIKLVTNSMAAQLTAMDGRLTTVENGMLAMQKQGTETALTLARVEGRLSSGASFTTPTATNP